MNFINGTLSEVNGAVRFRAENLDVEVPGGKATILRNKGFIGKDVIMGVRPEDIHEEPVFLEASLTQSSLRWLMLRKTLVMKCSST